MIAKTVSIVDQKNKAEAQLVKLAIKSEWDEQPIYLCALLPETVT